MVRFFVNDIGVNLIRYDLEIISSANRYQSVQLFTVPYSSGRIMWRAEQKKFCLFCLGFKIFKIDTVLPLRVEQPVFEKFSPMLVHRRDKGRVDRCLHDHSLSRLRQSFNRKIDRRHDPVCRHDPLSFYLPSKTLLHPRHYRLIIGIRVDRIAINRMFCTLNDRILYTER